MFVKFTNLQLSKIENFNIRILFRTPWYKSFDRDLQWVYTQFSHDIEKRKILG